MDETSWGLEDIFNPVDQSKIATREALTALSVKCICASAPVPGTPVEIISLSLEGMDIR